MKKSAGKRRTAHIVSHTHWDREWRFPIWETRLMLLDFMDELIEVLESGKYPGFLMDGQVAPVLDYLEVRPEMTERVKALVRTDKLQVGPWLYLPDEYPVDGECMVRNLLWGHRRARELGKVFNVGYTSFGWGQTAQLPQLYAGFGMDVAMIGKRVGRHRAPQCEFLWRGPDGSELLSTRFGELGRQNFYFKVHLSALFGVDHEGPGWVYRWAEGGVAFHRADPEQMEQDHARIDAPARWFPESVTPEMIEAAWNTMHESVLADDRLMMNGCDYTASQPMFPEMVDRLNAVDPDPDRQWVHTTMPEYVRLMRRKLDRGALVVVEGELRDGPAMAVTGNALTTRLYVKRLNKRAQNLLLRF
ncbi:MAG TPA: alpha-mannosidase, partial [Candidatus Hydrogenedentes bacterium]|nr:alpha-mannosidase [Candidatus Hydrogenedentota bacterium]